MTLHNVTITAVMVGVHKCETVLCIHVNKSYPRCNTASSQAGIWLGNEHMCPSQFPTCVVHKLVYLLYIVATACAQLGFILGTACALHLCTLHVRTGNTAYASLFQVTRSTEKL